MNSGKVPNDILNKIVLSKINTFREDVILRHRFWRACMCTIN